MPNDACGTPGGGKIGGRRPRTLPDYMRPGLAILFVGINPGLRSAALGHHFAGHSNRFWKLLFDARLVPRRLTFRDDARLPDWGYGLTNVVPRASRSSDELGPDDYRAGRRRLIARVRRHRPRVVALLGVSLVPVLIDAPDPSPSGRLGLQTATLGGARVFVLPNPSGRNAHYSYRTMLGFFRRLHRLFPASHRPHVRQAGYRP